MQIFSCLLKFGFKGEVNSSMYRKDEGVEPKNHSKIRGS